MPKVCTLFKKDSDGILRCVGFSFVSDDHEFGWQKDLNEDVLHFEGSVESMESTDV